MTRSFRTSARQRIQRIAAASALLPAALGSFAPSAEAQLINIKTLPIADGDQFAFFPAANFGIGTSIALPDTVHDPFVNPAKGARIGRSFFFGAPTGFSVSQRTGSGTTLPLGMVRRSGSVFGAAAAAIQELTDGRRAGPQFFEGDLARSAVFGDVAIVEPRAQSKTHTNTYAFVMLGRALGASGVSVGASGLVSGLRAVDGVNLMYPESRQVRQSGGSADLRLGALKDWRDGQSLEALLIHHRVGLSRDVSYADQYWDPIQRSIIERGRLQRERERTRTWGMQLAYQRPFIDSSWRIGATVTANLADHPSTPEVEIAAVPADQGRSSAFNVGIGVARTRSGTTVALDAIYEPISSHLWGVADSATAASASIEEGERTLDNRFRFSNAIVRAGVGHDFALEEQGAGVRLQAGIQARSIAYRLEQRDLLRDDARTGRESWMEWTRSWGATIRLPAVELQYRGRLTTGATRPGVAPFPSVPILASSIFPFPSTPRTTLSRVSVTSHQLGISVPLR